MTTTTLPLLEDAAAIGDRLPGIILSAVIVILLVWMFATILSTR